MMESPGGDGSHGDGIPIVAVGTAPGHGRRTLIRASGRGVITSVADRLTGDAAGACRAEQRGFFGTRWRLRSEVKSDLDLPVLLLIAPGPNSFTGEDTVEFEIPGNPALADRMVQEILEQLIDRLGDARLAGPGEFSARAFLAGHLDLADATGIAAGIAAERDVELDAAEALRRSESGERLRRLSDELLRSIARLEASIDFTEEEDVIGCTAGELRNGLTPIAEELDRLLESTAAVTSAVSSLPRVILAGPPNAGKSTLFNALVGEDRVVASPIAGTTRDTIEIEMELPLEDRAAVRRVILVDTAGRPEAGATKDPLGAAAAEATQRAIEAADLVLDCRPMDSPAAADGELTSTTNDQCRRIKVITQADRLEPEFDLDPEAIPTSGTTGIGLDRLQAAISHGLSDRPTGGSAVLAWQEMASEARSEVAEAIADLAHLPDSAGPRHPETTADRCRAAVDAIRRLDGGFDHEAVLDLVFGQFCIGK